MSYKTLEVELDNGRVIPCGAESLPASGHGLLTLLETRSARPAETCAELANRWKALHRLATAEAVAFADDVEQSRASLPPLKPAWD